MLTRFDEALTRRFAHKRSRLYIKLLVYLLAVSLGVWLTTLQSVFFLAMGIVLLGVMYAHGVELQHQVLHGDGTGNRAIDRVAGIVLGAPMLVSYTHYQYTHLRHHRDLGTDRDKEFFNRDFDVSCSGLLSFERVRVIVQFLLPLRFVVF